MNKRYENKSAYDPGRFRYSLTYRKQVSAPDGSGGTDVTFTDLLTVRAIREKLSEGNQLAITAGASLLTKDCYFIVRNRLDFYPEKDMNIVVDSLQYTIRAVIELDVPVTYIKLLCSGNV